MASNGRPTTGADIEPELGIAREPGIECELAVVNQRNGARDRWRLTEEFEGMTVNDGDLE